MCVCVTSAFRLYGQHCVFFSEFLNRPLEQSLPWTDPESSPQMVYNLLLATGSGYIHVHPIPQNMEHLDGSFDDPPNRIS